MHPVARCRFQRGLAACHALAVDIVEWDRRQRRVYRNICQDPTSRGQQTLVVEVGNETKQPPNGRPLNGDHEGDTHGGRREESVANRGAAPRVP